MGVSGAAGANAMEKIRAVPASSIVRGGARGEPEGASGEIDEAMRALLAEGVEQAQALERRTESAARTGKGGGQFTFGDQEHFIGGLQGLIGLPNGMNEAQWPEAGSMMNYLFISLLASETKHTTRASLKMGGTYNPVRVIQ